MKKLILAFTLFFLILPLTAKDEEVIFESILKDADFCTLPATKTDIGIIEELKLDLGWWTWWTLKFENGAVIVISRSALEPKEDVVWWIGKEYRVTKETWERTQKSYFRAKLIEEEKKKEEKPKTDS